MMDKDVQSVTQEDYGMADQYRDRHGLNGLNRDHLADLIAHARLASQPTSAEDAWVSVEQKFYRSEWSLHRLLEARNGGLATDDGEAWHYVYSSKDGTGGEYDMLRRRVPATRPTPDTQTAIEVERDSDGHTLICTGCGTVETVASIRRTHPTALSCCPERKMVRAVPATQAAAIGAEAIFAETVDERGWSLELLFGKGDDARDRMRAVSDALRSQPVAAPQQPQSEAQADKGNAEPVENSGAVSNDALRHLEIRSPLNRTIYRVIRQHRMGNMYDEDGFVGYPLVDLMSNEAPADIGTGEMEMVTLADEIEAALLARPPAQPQSEKVAAPQAEMADDVNWKAEWEAASSANIRYRKALDQICDLGCCGGKGSFQKALDIAVSAVSSTPPQPEGGTVVYDLLAALILVRDNNRNGVKGAEARRGWEMANAAIKNALQPEKTK